MVASKAMPARRRVAMSCGCDAASGQRFFVALEYHGVPARTAKKVRRQ
jgi:hypothetical protein